MARADKAAIECALLGILDESACAGAGPVQEAIRYAVLGDAQRIRPLLGMRVARLTGADLELSLRACCAVELLHCASLIVDDLPSMDDDRERRGRPATHCVFGEATAILAAFALVALAARIVVDRDCPDALIARRQDFQIRLLSTLDCGGLIAGQSLDLTLEGAIRDSNRVHMHELKTVPLFELAVAAGCTYTLGGMPKGLDRFGREFGVAFQIVDDWMDGEVSDRSDVLHQLDEARGCLGSLGLRGGPLHELIDYLDARVFAKDHCRR